MKQENGGAGRVKEREWKCVEEGEQREGRNRKELLPREKLSCCWKDMLLEGERVCACARVYRALLMRLMYT